MKALRQGLTSTHRSKEGSADLPKGLGFHAERQKSWRVLGTAMTGSNLPDCFKDHSGSWVRTDHSR